MAVVNIIEVAGNGDREVVRTRSQRFYTTPQEMVMLSQQAYFKPLTLLSDRVIQSNL